MNGNEMNEKKQLRIFLAIAFGLPVIMGLFMWYGYNQGGDLTLFSMTHMFYPAAGAMVALLVCSRKNNLIPKAFFICYLILTAVMVVLSLLGLFTGNLLYATIGSIVVMVGCVLLWIFLFVAKKDRRAAYGLSRKNWKATIAMILLYCVLYTIRMIAALFTQGGLSAMAESLSTSQSWIYLISSLVLYVIMFVPYLGEEYGWRYFLQPLLQKRFGAVKGVLLLGVLWGVWHLPLNFFYYTSPADGIISVANQVVVCLALGIFYAYAYMKTDNIWCVTALHFLNNNLVPFFSGDLTGQSMSGYSLGWMDVLTMAVLMTIFFGWPVVTKYFRSRKHINPTPDARADRVGYDLAAKQNEAQTVGGN